MDEGGEPEQQFEDGQEEQMEGGYEGQEMGEEDGEQIDMEGDSPDGQYMDEQQMAMQM